MVKQMYAGRQPILHGEKLTAEFSGSDAELRALGGVSLSLYPEEFVCVVGPSGCGKSTLLRLLAGLMRPTTGQVWFEGNELLRPDERIGFVFQRPNLMPWRTVEENIRLPLDLDGISRAQAEQIVCDLLKLVGLLGFERAYPRELSGGMAQRVALARALAHDPQVLLLDEPFASLDALTRERMATEVARIAKDRRKTVLMVTHSIDEALILADRVLVLTSRPGRLRLEVDVPLGRPRLAEMAYSKEFGELAVRIRSAIEEAV
jgi:NitT/TauT family transport system ATP-binding protein